MPFATRKNPIIIGANLKTSELSITPNNKSPNTIYKKGKNCFLVIL